MIEILIAVMTFAIVLGAVNTVFYSALRLRNKTALAVEKALPIQQATTIIKHDLAGIVPPGGLLAGALRSGTGTSSTPSAGSLTTLGSLGSMNQEGSTEFFTTSGAMDQFSPWAEVQKVNYYLRDPTNRAFATGRDLVREVTRNLLATTEDLPSQQVLMGGVEYLEFYFYDGSEWRDSWDSSTEETGLPKAVKVLIQLAGDESERQSRSLLNQRPAIELVVPVVVQGRTNQTQTAGGQP